MKRPRALSVLIWIAVAAAIGPACKPSRRATPGDCLEIFNRLVELEMDERGFRDNAAVARAKERLRRELAAPIARCEGRRLSETALACVHRAHRAEEVTHSCLE